jgi:hypothetical protein
MNRPKLCLKSPLYKLDAKFVAIGSETQLLDKLKKVDLALLWLSLLSFL